MIHALFAPQLFAQGDRAAIAAQDGALSYRQLAVEVSAYAARLIAAGVRSGERVAVQLPNSCAAVVALLAAAQSGAVPVPIPVGLRGATLHALVQACEARLAICPQNLAADWNCPALQVDLGAATASQTSIYSEARRDEHELATIIYTSGSTGAPKGVMLRRSNMTAVLAAVHEYLLPTANDVYYSALPLSSSYGYYQMVSALSLGAKLVLDKSFAFPVHSLRFLATQRATIFAAVPTQIAWLLASPQDHTHALQSLRLLTTAAAALPIEHARRLQAMLPAARIFVMYGQTECKRISYLDPADLSRKPGSVGRGLSIQKHLLLDSTGAPVPTGQPGELVVQGPHVMAGYWQQPELTNAKLKPVPGQAGLWLHTGDEFRADQDGYLYFLGRHDEILKIGGNKVSPTEIENALVMHPAVSEAAVVGMDDDLWGMAPKAFVVLRAGAEANEATLQRHCATSLPRYMVPKSVQFLTALPKTESGKVRKRELY